tara:strand:+ start:36 stop:248 length:213 start_codon:yes stop_codon:yes gene_type:complete
MFYYGEPETMSSSKELDIIANLYHKTKDKTYKDLWYKKVKEYANGLNHNKRRTLSTNSSDNKDVRRNRTD